MTFLKSILLLLSLTLIAALMACSSSNHVIPPPNSGPLADGNYVFSLAGTDNTDASPYYVAGAFTVARGVITGGEQDFVDVDFELSDTISAIGSSITATADGNLTIVLATGDSNIGVDGVETLNGTILPLSTTDRTLITEFDASATGSGEIDPQSTSGVAAATPTAGYAFGLNGIDGLAGISGGGLPISMGGVINVDGPGTISGTGSIFDANDGGSGSTYAGLNFANTSVVSAPDTFGRVTFTLDTNSVNFPQIVLAGYIVDSTHVRLVETGDTYEGALGGTALSQGANTGTFGTSSVVAGNTYVVGLNGLDINGFFQTVAQVTPSGTTSTAGGFVDFNDLVISSATTAISPDPVTSSAYAVDPTGDVTITNLTDGTNAFNVQLYLDGNNNAMAITLDTLDAIGGFGFQQPAAAVGAFTASNFNGGYGLNVTGWDFNYDGEFDAVGPITADGTSAITGTVDLNWLLTGTFTAAPVTGTFTANADGVFSDGFTGLDLTDCTLFTPTGGGCSADLFNYYLTGDAAGDSFTIETDLNQLTLGYFTQQ
jgi:hypothetical protein